MGSRTGKTHKVEATEEEPEEEQEAGQCHLVLTMRGWVNGRFGWGVRVTFRFPSGHILGCR